MNIKLITADGLDLAFKVVAAVYILLLLVPVIPQTLGIDVTASGVTVAVFLALVGMARPRIEAWVFSARVKRALSESKTNTKP